MNSKPELSGRPLDRLPEPYRSRLLSAINSMAIDGMHLSEANEELAVQAEEKELANGGRERRRKAVLNLRKSMRRAGIPFVKVNNPLPSW